MKFSIAVLEEVAVSGTVAARHESNFERRNVLVTINLHDAALF